METDTPDKTNTIELSLIIPVYNVKPFLRECLESVRAQTFTEWECIIVDDGSTDGSGEVCDEFAALDTRFKVIHQPNGGISAARNSGLAASHGRYIGFVDPDDLMYEHHLECLHGLISTYDADVAQGSYESLYASYSKTEHLVKEVEVFDRGHVARELLTGNKIPNYMWIKLFKREVIDVPFPEGLVFEDIYAMSSWVKNINRMVLSPEIIYGYRRREGSIVNSNYADNRIDYLKASASLVNTLHQLEPAVVTDDLKRYYKWKWTICAAKTVARKVDDKEIRRERVRQIADICRTFKLPKLLRSNLKIWWRSRLLISHPTLFIYTMRAVKRVSFHGFHRKRKLF